jgi:hypothetical protein
MELGLARLVFGDLKSNINYFKEVKGLYLPSYTERRIDTEYIKGLLENEYTTIL